MNPSFFQERAPKPVGWTSMWLNKGGTVQQMKVQRNTYRTKAMMRTARAKASKVT